MCPNFYKDTQLKHLEDFNVLAERKSCFLQTVEKQKGYSSWIVGIVEKGQGNARIFYKPHVIEM